MFRRFNTWGRAGDQKREVSWTLSCRNHLARNGSHETAQSGEVEKEGQEGQEQNLLKAWTLESGSGYLFP